MSHDVTFLTPTYAHDYERFCLQRESIERCGITIQHLAIVNHEDIALFRDVAFQKNLTLVSTRDLLPSKIERRRLAWGARRREVRYWQGRPAIHGWMAQQLLKMAAPSIVETEGIVCLDSDTLFVDYVSSADFFAEDGRMHLYETEDDLDAEMVEWFVRSLRFLGVPTRHQPLKRYVHSPVIWHRQVLVDMQSFITQRHSKAWMDAILDDEMIYEYMTYGVFARHVDSLIHHVPTKPSLCAYYWWPEQVEDIQHDFSIRIAETSAKAVLINSNIGRDVSFYRNLVEKTWENGVGGAVSTLTGQRT